MLIRFSVTNFLSFKEEAELLMVASNERIHPHHVFRTSSRNHPNILRAAAIYGANSAGKSNLVKAIYFLRNLVVKSTEPEEKIPVQRFRMDAACMQEPSIFSIEFRAKNTNYLYSVVVTSSSVCSEKLFVITSDRETLLFSRKTLDDKQVEVEWGDFIGKLSKKEKLFFEFVAQGTRPNQLLLRETIERNMDRFRPVYNWFRRTLQIIEPNSVYRDLEVRLDADENFRDFLAHVLKTAGTGISGVLTPEVDINTLTDMPQEIMQEVKENLTEEKVAVLRNHNGGRLVIAMRQGALRAFKLATVHSGNGSVTEGTFDIYEESDGTQRLFDLIPILYDLTVGSAKERVYIIDEIGRSLHPHLTNMLVGMHLDAVNSGRPSQLIVTTHETNLLDLDILRRDEIWFVEKRDDGSTDLYSLSEFQPRYDKDIRKDYLIGRYGGIPFIGNTHRLRLPIQKQSGGDDLWSGN